MDSNKDSCMSSIPLLCGNKGIRFRPRKLSNDAESNRYLNGLMVNILQDSQILISSVLGLRR